ncbi:carbon storage regulator [bacterium]|nr:carbon storage regulator [bacterium]
MLVLSRKEGEKLRLGDEILITVVKVGADKVRLGIQAPSNLLILRDELEVHDLESIEEEERITLVFTQEVDQPAPKPMRIAA